MTPITDLCVVGIGCGLGSLTLTRSTLTRSIRAALMRWPVIGDLASCPYCLAHWAGALGALTLGPNTLTGYLINALAVTAIAVLFQGVVQKLWLMQENELDRMRGLLADAAKALKELSQ